LLYELGPICREVKKKISQAFLAIETNGTLPIPPYFDWISCSPKPLAKYKIHCTPNELKYVVDNEFEVKYIPDQYKYQIPIWLQPEAGDLDNSLPKAIQLVAIHPYLRLGVQLHKFYHLK
jgi:organic radical activating enzyme